MDFGKWGELIDVFLAKNSQINLSAIRDAEGVYVKHVLDSLELLKIFSFNPGQVVCDLGTGWGFPLLPLAIENPEVRFVGMDARKKKIDAIASMITDYRLQTTDAVLSNVDLVWSRVEEYHNIVISSEVERSHLSEKEISPLRSLHSLHPKGTSSLTLTAHSKWHKFWLPKKFDVVMARAVAHVEVLIPWMMQIVKKGGKLVLYKQLDSRLQNASLQATEKTEHEVLVELCQKYRLSIEKEHRYVLEGTTTERVIYVLG